MSQLEAHEVSLHRVFSSDYDFRIPDYQRPYAWDIEQASQLLDDLIEALERNQKEPYFLGSIVLVKDKNASDSEVIDGQQRLTTLTILLAVLRDLTGDDQIRVDLERMIAEPGNKIRKLEPKPRLALRARDASFFANFVQATNSIEKLLQLTPDDFKTDAQAAIQNNAHALRQVLHSWDEARRLELISMLSERTFLVTVSTPNLDSAHRIFSVLNARGLDLSPSDIFKSLVIGNLDEGISELYATRWEDAEEALGRDDFADLFLHLRMIFSKARARRELLKEFPEQVLVDYPDGKGAQFVDEVLVPYADAYTQIRDRSYKTSSGAENVNSWFRRLTQLDNNDWRPPALWALKTHANNSVWLDRFYRELERLASCMFLQRSNTSQRAQRYADLLRQLSEGRGFESSALTLSESEKSECMKRLDGEIYLSTIVRKYVLLRLDETLSKSQGVTYEHRLITVEHVLPQNPKVDSVWTQTFSEDQRKTWTHKLANLVLLNRAKNSEAQNFDFEKKKSRYFSGVGVAPFALTSQVLNFTEWTPVVLQDRQQDLLGVLKSEWGF
jgi:hypothetical protein